MSNPYEARRPYYRAELAKGVERFLEPRRDTCPWCGSSELSIRLQTTDLIQRKPGRFTVEQCGACQHIFQNPRLTPAGLDFYYRDFYDGLGQNLVEQAFDASDRAYQGRVDMVKRFTTPSAWLDVGTGYGHFCRFARRAWPGARFDGLDLGLSVEEAQRRGWIDLSYREEFVTLTDELANRYDVVSMHHYLEHTREPFDELDAAAKILPSGGYLLIELPDPQSLFGHLFGRWWLPWFQPQHLHMIPIGNLRQALTDRGFSTVAIERGAAHQGAELFFALALALIAIAPNPQLPWLTDPPTRVKQLRRTLVWAAGRPLLVIAYLLDTLLSDIVRRTHGGNTYRLLACKNG